ncbi:MAG: TIR domain-containing protein [Gammaproteobacteria bacterium]
MAGVFINYRRGDARSEAGRLFDWLSQYFGKDQVFMDVSGSIEPGLEFDRVIEKAVSSCKVLIVVIGKQWLTVVDEKGNRRLEDANDFVRMEISAALKRDIRVVPVLVEGATMPEEGSLPEDLKRLCKRQALEVSDNRWEFDTQQLVKVLEKAGVTPVGPRPPEPPKPTPHVTKKTSWKPIASLVLGVLLMISYSELSVDDQDTKIGALVFALIALGLGIAAFYDVKRSPDAGGAKGKVLAISGMVLGGILTLAFIGTLTTSDPSAPPVVDPQPSSENLPISAPAVPASSVPASPASAFIDISGSWRGPDGIYIFQQSGSNVNVQLFNWNQLLIAQGAGTIVQGVVTIEYARLDNTGGEARLQVSANSRQMTGNYRNLVTGEAGPMTLVR